MTREEESTKYYRTSMSKSGNDCVNRSRTSEPSPSASSPRLGLLHSKQFQCLNSLLDFISRFVDPFHSSLQCCPSPHGYDSKDSVIAGVTMWMLCMGQTGRKLRLTIGSLSMLVAQQINNPGYVPTVCKERI